MQLQRVDRIEAFYPLVESFLLAREAEHNLLIGLCTTLMKTRVYREPPYLAAVLSGQIPVCVALRTPPHNLLLSECDTQAVVPLLVEDVHRLYEDLPGVMGPPALSLAFARAWQDATGRTFELSTSMRTFKLNRVQPVHATSGQIRPATLADLDLLVDWLMAFHVEALSEIISSDEAEERVRNRLQNDQTLMGYRLWCDDDRPVSMAGYGGPTPHGIRIGPVYTPIACRGRGYASMLTAALSQELLDQGREFCFLFTDLNNPTSNHIYQVIGYQPICDLHFYRFSLQTVA